MNAWPNYGRCPKHGVRLVKPRDADDDGHKLAPICPQCDEEFRARMRELFHDAPNQPSKAELLP